MVAEMIWLADASYAHASYGLRSRFHVSYDKVFQAC